MKRNIILLLLTVFGFNVLAQQSTDDIGKINLAVIVPDEIKDFSVTNISQLKTKIEQICTRCDVASSFVTNGFYILPSVEIITLEMVENGMQNIFVVKADVTLTVRQSNGTIISSTSKTLKGSGNSKEKAITNLVTSIPVNDLNFKNFISESKEKILTYYATHCNEIILKARQRYQLEEFEEAISILLSVPEDIPCYSQILNLSSEIYTTYQDKLCAELLSTAKAEIALQNYEEAAEKLTQISPTSMCYITAAQMFNEIEKKVSDLEKRNWNFHMKQYDNSVDLEKMRIQAAKEIAKAKYSQQINITRQQFIKL